MERCFPNEKKSSYHPFAVKDSRHLVVPGNENVNYYLYRSKYKKMENTHEQNKLVFHFKMYDIAGIAHRWVSVLH